MVCIFMRIFPVLAELSLRGNEASPIGANARTSTGAGNIESNRYKQLNSANTDLSAQVCEGKPGRTTATNTQDAGLYPNGKCGVELDVPVECVLADQTSLCPIVFYLHGSGEGLQSKSFKRTSGVHDANFIGVYPQGEGPIKDENDEKSKDKGGWNTGPKKSNNCAWNEYDCTEDPNEGQFIADIIANLRNMGASGNVYVVGTSNGAANANKLAVNADETLPIKGIVTYVTQLTSTPEKAGPGPYNFNTPAARAAEE